MPGWRARGLPLLVLEIFALSTLACNLVFSSTGSVEVVETSARVLFVAPVNRLVDPAIPEYARGAQIRFRAVAVDTQAGVYRIVFSVDERVIGEVFSTDPTGERYLDATAVWSASEPKGYGITVVAYRADGSLLGQDQRSIRVVDRSANVFLPPASPTTTTLPTATGAALPASANGGLAAEPVGPAVSGPQAQVNVATLNVREGPGINFGVVGTLFQGEQIAIVGRSSTGEWLAISLEGRTAWVFANLTTFAGDVFQLPLIEDGGGGEAVPVHAANGVSSSG